MVNNIKAKCFYFDCPNNEIGICKTVYFNLKSFCDLFHEFDGKNYVKCLCG